MTGGNLRSTRVRPLTKQKRGTGELYRRRPEVEMQLELSLSFADSNIFEKWQAKNRSDKDYLLDETIVYFLRDAHRRDDDPVIELLYAELNRRIIKLLKRFHKYFDNPFDFEDFTQKVEMEIIKKIFDLNSDMADYAEVNFGDFVVTQAEVIKRGSLVKINREQKYLRLDEGYENEDQQTNIQLESIDLSPEDKLILCEGISLLPADIQKAVVLIADGWKVESKDESELTVIKILNISSRTIRNWLREARTILAGYEGELR